jgi:tetratricopeptide (TPR) repeat protein
MGRKKKSKSNGSKKVKEETVTTSSSTMVEEDMLPKHNTTDIKNINIDDGDDDDDDSPQAAAVALQCKEQGNVYYKNKEYQKAAEAYQAGLDSYSQSASVAIALRSNLAMTLLKLELFELADMECSRIVTVEPQNVKGACVRLVGWLLFFIS